ncbi:MAG: DMT family transporter [Bacteroidales bacterium]|nr:DMT family transporter [Bacteroidales bacterium]
MTIRKNKTHIYAVLAMLIWGMSYIWTKIVFQCYSPFTTVFLRFLISSIILIIYLKYSGRLTKIDKKDYLLFLFAAFFNPFLYFLGENFGLKFASPTVSAVVISTIPVFTPVAVFLVTKERLSKLNIFGLLISFLGIIIIIVEKDFSIQASPLGLLFLFGAVVAAIIYSFFLKKLASKYSSITLITYLNIIGTIYFLPLFLAFDYSEFITIIPSTDVIISLLFLGLFASSIAFVFFTISVKNIGINKTNLYTNLIPVFAALISYFYLGEYFSFNKIVGIIIVILGVLISQINKQRSIIRIFS